MKELSKNKGLTLVEIIISMAILSIIVIVFLGMFTSGLKGIFAAGHKSRAEHTAERAIESRIAGKSTPVDNTTVSVTSSSIGITFTDSTGTVTVSISSQGIIYDTLYNDGKRTVPLTTFVSN